MSLGTGLGKVKGKVFRIGHLGHFNDLMLCGTHAGSRWARSGQGAASRRRILAAMEVLKGREVVSMPKSKAAVA